MRLQHIDEILEIKELCNIRMMLSNVKINEHKKNKIIEMLSDYVSDMFFMCKGHMPNEKLIIILTKRLSINFCILFIKIYNSLNSSEPQEETDNQSKQIFFINHYKIPKIKKHYYKRHIDHPIISYNSSNTSRSTQQISNTCKINDIECYMKWLMQTLKLTDVDVITSSILLKHLYDIKDDFLYEWLKKKYDVIMIVIIIIARKLYGIDEQYDNYYYSKLLKINILEINITEIVLILHMNLYISEKEYNDYFSELYLEYINCDK